MKHNLKRHLGILLIATMFLWSCSKDDTLAPSTNASVSAATNKTLPPDQSGYIRGWLNPVPTYAVAVLYNQDGSVAARTEAMKDEIRFERLRPATYDMKIFYSLNDMPAQQTYMINDVVVMEYSTTYLGIINLSGDK